MFGNQTAHYQSDPSTMVGMVYWAEQVIVHALTPFGYRGYCYDAYSGMYYLQSRYYDPQTGRFINADDTNYLNATGTVLGCNLFAYCENDPVNFVDSSGFYKDYAFTIVPYMRVEDIVYSISRNVQSTSKTDLKANVCYVPVSGKKYYSYNADVLYIASNSAISVKYSNFQNRYAMYPYYYTTYYHKKTYNEWLYYIAQRHTTVFDVIQEQVMSILNMDYSDWDSATYAMGEVTYPEKLKMVSDILFYYEFLSLVTKLLTQWFDKVDNYIMEILNRRPKLEKSSWKIAIMWSISSYKYGFLNSGTGYRRTWHLTKMYYAWEL
ncbi:MAG: RHS repeat-associated core domain-containing protein [Clostridia bacterium]|nr:RHS repeat-associated core domain-containing protein [Clostridia bacterium]